MTFDPVAARAKLNVIIARQDAERGRPLTDREKLENLASALAEDDTPCPFCGVRDDEMCGWQQDGEACKLDTPDA